MTTRRRDMGSGRRRISDLPNALAKLIWLVGVPILFRRLHRPRGA